MREQSNIRFKAGQRNRPLLRLLYGGIFAAWCCLLFNANPIFAAEKVFEQKSFQPDGRHLCKTNPDDILLLAENGKANAEIVVVQPGPPVAAYAARELKTFLDQATGADFKIVRNRTGDLPAIFVGDSEWARSWGVDVNSLARDGFIIRRVKDIIIIAGRDDPCAEPEKFTRLRNHERGTIFGVYDFLERFLGARFYFPGDIGTVVPKSPVLRVPAMDVLEEPDFSVREFYMVGRETWFDQSDQEEIGRLKRQQKLRLREQTKYIPVCHGLGRLGYLDRFGQSHPEYFALYPDGKRGNDTSLPGPPCQLCFSNEGLRDEVYQDAEAFLTGKPASLRGALLGKTSAWDINACLPGYFNAMPQDGRISCHCPQCRPFYDSKCGGDLVWEFICFLAQRLKKNGVPGYVTNLAYEDYSEAPDMQIPDNVLVMVCTLGPMAEKNPPSYQEKEDKRIRDWYVKLKHKVWLWNYLNYTVTVPGIPPLTTKWIAEYYKRNAPYIIGAFLQADSDNNFLFQYLNRYVYMKVAWDLSTDLDKLIAEHHQKLFGSAAEQMGRFFARLEELWTNEFLGGLKDTNLGPINTEMKRWEIFNEERMAELAKYIDESEKLTANDPDALKRVKFFKEKFFGVMLKEREKSAEHKREIENLVFEVTPLPKGQVITVDGVLNEPAWQTAADVSFVSADNKPAIVKTRMRALWTEKYLYFGFDCEEPKSYDIAVIDRKRDDSNIWQDTSIEIFLNPSNDRTNYFQFIVNARGNLSDLAMRMNEAKVADRNWNSKAEAAAKIEKGAWTVEIAIPLEDLNRKGIKNGETMVANFNRSRYIRGKTEENQLYTWSPFVNLRYSGAFGPFHRPDRFGKMKFVTEKSK